MKKLLEGVATVLLVAAFSVGILAVLARSPLSRAIPVLHDTTPMIVLSGSMEPKIKTGSLVFIRPVDTSKIAVNDVIAFVGEGAPGQTGPLTTHRVVEIVRGSDGIRFRTKGDANPTPDPWLVPVGAVHGEEAATLPYFGYLSAFTRSRLGFSLFILIPALVVIVGEVIEIVRELKAQNIAVASASDD